MSAGSLTMAFVLLTTGQLPSPAVPRPPLGPARPGRAGRRLGGEINARPAGPGELPAGVPPPGQPDFGVVPRARKPGPHRGGAGAAVRTGARRGALAVPGP